MNFREYEDMIKDVPYPDTIEYKLPFLWLHPQNLPLGVTSIGDSGLSIIKIPERAMNRYGRKVPVITFSRQAFSEKSNITDIVLPQSIERFPKGAFEGCTGLKRITVPRKVKVIKEGTFAGCKQLEDVYFEGTMEEWNRIIIIHHKHEVEFGQLIPGTPVQEVKAERMIFIPGNEAIFSANIHFLCGLPGEKFNCSFNVKVGNKDITEFFRTI